MAVNPEANPDQVRELLGYTIDDLGSLANSTLELSKVDPQSAQQIAAQALGALADSSEKFAAILGVSSPAITGTVDRRSPKAKKEVRVPLEEEIAHPTSIGSAVLADKRVGILIEDPSAKTNIRKIRTLREKTTGSKWGRIEDVEQLGLVCDLVYGLDIESYLDQAYDFALALPSTTDFRPFQLVLKEGRLASRTSKGCPAVSSNTVMLFNLVGMSTYFGGIRSSVVKEACGRKLGEMLGSLFGSGHKGSDVFISRGSRHDLTYLLSPDWRAEGVLGQAPR